MPRPPIDLNHWIAKIPNNVTGLAPESESPIAHYKRGANDAWNLLQYFDRNVSQAVVRPTVFERHQHRLRSWVIVSIVEAFERYLKETAAVCIDHIASYVFDDRLDVLRVSSTKVAAHFSEGSVGRALCESDTWLDVDKVSKRFGRILADPYATNWGITLFGQAANLVARTTSLRIVFQLRHSIVHNVGVITNSDAARLRVLTRSAVAAPQMLWPTNGDVFYIKLFLDETADWVNGQIANRLATLLTNLHAADNSLFVPADEAQEMASQFQTPVTVAGAPATP